MSQEILEDMYQKTIGYLCDFWHWENEWGKIGRMEKKNNEQQQILIYTKLEVPYWPF